MTPLKRVTFPNIVTALNVRFTAGERYHPGLRQGVPVFTKCHSFAHNPRSLPFFTNNRAGLRQLHAYVQREVEKNILKTPRHRPPTTCLISSSLQNTFGGRCNSAMIIVTRDRPRETARGYSTRSHCTAALGRAHNSRKVRKDCSMAKDGR